MKRLYSARNAVEAHDLRFVLAAHGIEAEVFGDRTSLEASFAFTPQSGPGVYVDESDIDAANAVLQQFVSRTIDAATRRQLDLSELQGVRERPVDTCWRCQRRAAICRSKVCELHRAA